MASRNGRCCCGCSGLIAVEVGEWNNHLHMSCLLVVQMNGEGMASRA